VLKKGPGNIKKIIEQGQKIGYKYTDIDFFGMDALYWDGFT
jgi:hypothetical protein